MMSIFGQKVINKVEIRPDMFYISSLNIKILSVSLSLLLFISILVPYI